ncbi:MAG: gfo/Idh/MocA family oxidoreductase [bacterium]|nr:gfo/Idh/MocA family oxidoreductase [bacterium]
MKRTFQRRSFLRGTAAGLAWSLAPVFVPARIFAAPAPSDQIVVGWIGIGSRGNQLLGENRRKETMRIAALADVDRVHLLRARQIIEDQYGIERPEPKIVNGWRLEQQPVPAGAVAAYNDYRRLLDRGDLDGVVCAVPDHWHAKIYIDALDAGLDVYGEKPLSLTINQGRHIARKVEETGRVFQTGSQQRSMSTFRTAVNYVRNGALGEIKSVRCNIGGGRAGEMPPDEPAPPNLDWEMWLGPAPLVPYNPRRCHLRFRSFYDYSGGNVTDWGAHHCDIAQWGLGMDGTGPRKIEGGGTFNPAPFNTLADFEFTYTYGNGVPVTLVSGGKNGVTFTGEKGEIFVSRDEVASTPDAILKEPLPASAVRVEESNDHFQNWLDCIKSRNTPIASAEIGHRSITVPHLCNIAARVGRTLEWNPDEELFVNDPEANAHLNRDERAPYYHMAGY